MSDDTIGMTVFLVMAALITAMLVYGCQYNREHEIKKSQACFEQTKRNECWEGLK